MATEEKKKHRRRLGIFTMERDSPVVVFYDGTKANLLNNGLFRPTDYVWDTAGCPVVVIVHDDHKDLCWLDSLDENRLCVIEDSELVAHQRIVEGEYGLMKVESGLTRLRELNLIDTRASLWQIISRKPNSVRFALAATASAAAIIWKNVTGEAGVIDALPLKSLLIIPTVKPADEVAAK